MDPSFYYQQWPAAPSGWPPGMPPQGWYPYTGLPFAPAVPVETGHLQQEEGEQQQQQLFELKPMHQLQPLQPFAHHYPQPGTEHAFPTTSSHHDYANYVLPPQLQPTDSKPHAAFLITPPPSSSSFSSASSDCTTPPPALDHSHQQQQLLYSFDSKSDRSSVMPSPYLVGADEQSGQEDNTTLECSIRSDDSPPALRKERLMQKRGQKRKRLEEEHYGEKEPERPRAPAISSLNQTSVFCKVTGRLSVVGFQKLYHVTVDEIDRRTEFPERLNRSHLGPLLRRGKIKGCGDTLQELLESRGLTSNNSVNRKKHPLTCLSALLEEEAAQLSADHREIALAHFPFIGISRMFVRAIETPSQLADTTGETKAALAVISPLVALLKECMEADEGGVYSHNSPLRAFALASHGLGVDEALLAATLLEKYLTVLDQEACAQMERVNTAALKNYHPLLANQFPGNTEQCLLPVGRLHVPDDDEESMGGRQFAEIPGRLTLNNRKYSVSVAEVLRRVRAPESLNLSILGSQLRKGKTKDNGNSLRDALAQQGIKIDQGRRKAARITCFTAMSEGECLALAKDLHDAVGRTFPFVAISTELNIRFGATTQHAIHCRRKGLEAASKLCGALTDTLLQLRLPVDDRIPHKIADEAYLVHTYSSLTHGFGPDTIGNWTSTFCKLFDYARSSLPMV